jgi:hypothetical protein
MESDAREAYIKALGGQGDSEFLKIIDCYMNLLKKDGL